MTNTATPIITQIQIPTPDHPFINPSVWFMLFMLNSFLFCRFVKCWRPADNVFEKSLRRDQRGGIRIVRSFYELIRLRNYGCCQIS